MFVRYEKIYTNFFGFNKRIKILEGLQKRDGYIYEIISFNKFKDKETKIPSDYNKVKVDKEYIKTYKYNKLLKLLTKNNKYYKNHPKGKFYFTHNNGDREYLVYISKNKNVSIYTRSDKYYIDNDDYSEKDSENRWMYIDLIKKYTANKIFIGKSLKGEMTTFSGGYGRKFDGNTILLNIGKNKYVLIGYGEFEFKTTDKILEFYSPLGNNDVPYPVAFGEKNIYFLTPQKYVPIKYIEKYNKKFKLDAYLYYYGHKGNIKLQDYAIPIKYY